MIKKWWFSLLTALVVCSQGLSAQTISFGRPIYTNDILSYQSLSRNAWRSVSLAHTGGNKEFDVREIREEALRSPQRMASKIMAGPSHASQTITQIFILSMVQRYYQNQRINTIKGQSDINKGFGSSAVQAGYDIVNSFEIYAALLGAGIFSKVLKKQLESIRWNLRQAGAGKAFTGFVFSTMGTTVAFVGWEVGMQLWQEAIFNLDSEEEITVAMQLNFDKIFLKQATEQERKIFIKVLDNMFMIFNFKKPEFLQNLVANTWRLRIATGHFTTLVASMVVGAKAGAMLGSVVPGLGTGVCGFVGGLAGGGMWMLIPHEFNDAITDKYKEMRIQQTHNRLNANTNEILRIATLFDQGKGTQDQDKQLKMLTAVLARRQAIRNDALTVYFEKYYTAYGRKRNAEDFLAMLDQYQKMDPKKIVLTSNPADLQEILDGDRSIRMYTFKNYEELLKIKEEEEGKKSLAIAEMKSIEEQMLEFYYNEAVRSLGFLRHKSPAIKENMQAAIDKEVEKIEWLNIIIRLIVAGQSPEKLQAFQINDVNSEDIKELTKMSEIHIMANSMRRFYEEKFLAPTLTTTTTINN